MLPLVILSFFKSLFYFCSVEAESRALHMSYYYAISASSFLSFVFFFVVLVVEPRDLCVLCKQSSPALLSPSLGSFLDCVHMMDIVS